MFSTNKYYNHQHKTGADIFHSIPIDEKCIKFWSENQKERDHAEDVAVDGRTILKWIIKKQHVKVWNGFTWLKLGTSGGLLGAR
jgi:hypothetical protein